MKSLAVLLIVLAVLGLVVLLLKRRATLESSSAQWPFYAKRPLSQPEQVLYHRLIKALPDHIVLAQGSSARRGAL